MDGGPARIGQCLPLGHGGVVVEGEGREEGELADGCILARIARSRYAPYGQRLSPLVAPVIHESELPPKGAMLERGKKGVNFRTLLRIRLLKRANGMEAIFKLVLQFTRWRN